jgi:hypothetical protein
MCVMQRYKMKKGIHTYTINRALIVMTEAAHSVNFVTGWLRSDVLKIDCATLAMITTSILDI